jgi:hypothetical protein
MLCGFRELHLRNSILSRRMLKPHSLKPSAHNAPIEDAIKKSLLSGSSTPL